MRFKLKYNVLIIVVNILFLLTLLNHSILTLPKKNSVIPDELAYITQDTMSNPRIIQRKNNGSPEIKVNSVNPMNSLRYLFMYHTTLILCFIPLNIIIDIRSKISLLLTIRFEGSKYKSLTPFS